MNRRDIFLESVDPNRREQDAMLVARGYKGLDEARRQEKAREQSLITENRQLMRTQRGN